jgi:pre-mRNA-splicing factor ATP-dependent RNA helicase DHX16
MDLGKTSRRGVQADENDREFKRRVSSPDKDKSVEEELLKDQREKEELEQHMRERDAAKTRRLTEPKAIRRKSNAAEENKDMETLRNVSRQEYLKRREEKKVQELRDDIEDEQYLFEGVKLSEAEYHDLTHKKEIYDVLAKKKGLESADNDYRIPEAYDDQQSGVNQEKRFSVAMQRYNDSNAEKEEDWEEHQIRKATLQYGSKNKRQVSNDYHLCLRMRLVLSRRQ